MRKTFEQEFNEDVKNLIGTSLLLHKIEKQAFKQSFENWNIDSFFKHREGVL